MEYFNADIELMSRSELDIFVDERVRNTIRYSAENSPFYKRWFKKNKIDPFNIKEHEDLRELPIISGKTIRENQPPQRNEFLFKSVECSEVFTIHETSGTSGIPKTFFSTWDDWKRYAEKYARIFVSQGLGEGDRMAVCASYGMNVGANTMTVAAKRIGFTIIPEGKCTFPVRVMTTYKPTAIVGSVFKLIHLAQRLEDSGIDPKESGVEKLIVGGEGFAPESRAYLDKIWGLDVCNTYGSTEGAMCGECKIREGLHVPEDLVHMDLYNEKMKDFVSEGNEGKIVLTTLIPNGEKAGTVLINYETDDQTEVLSKEKCRCGRTHMRIKNPKRVSENVYLEETSFNRIDIESGVFHPQNMKYLTGEYEAFLYYDPVNNQTTMQVGLECRDIHSCDIKLIKDNFLSSFFKNNKILEDYFTEGIFDIIFRTVKTGDLGLYKLKGRPKRIVDRR
ncbi:coenzyme F390 synthetase [Methanoplanus sp. FWC-SCC4]|uniref:Coenzyme F390 synthetase n=1 Tax=Methanochimaera problematica TaxID=2609417 RepID=A0AA97FCX7_9EURY|nr:coenzyme F390 synthetase [Methanoplanus sp. FWC-SCC4]WOF15919.1 coenzyme F390 synthetase [Methanoplanus sp. FWC-SCC4]